MKFFFRAIYRCYRDAYGRLSSSKKNEAKNQRRIVRPFLRGSYMVGETCGVSVLLSAAKSSNVRTSPDTLSAGVDVIGGGGGDRKCRHAG